MSRGYLHKNTPRGIMDSWIPGFQIILSTRSDGKRVRRSQSDGYSVGCSHGAPSPCRRRERGNAGGTPRQSEAATEQSRTFVATAFNVATALRRRAAAEKAVMPRERLDGARRLQRNRGRSSLTEPGLRNSMCDSRWLFALECKRGVRGISEQTVDKRSERRAAGKNQQNAKQHHKNQDRRYPPPLALPQEFKEFSYDRDSAHGMLSKSSAEPI